MYCSCAGSSCNLRARTDITWRVISTARLSLLWPTSVWNQSRSVCSFRKPAGSAARFAATWSETALACRYAPVSGVDPLSTASMRCRSSAAYLASSSPRGSTSARRFLEWGVSKSSPFLSGRADVISDCPLRETVSSARASPSRHVGEEKANCTSTTPWGCTPTSRGNAWKRRDEMSLSAPQMSLVIALLSMILLTSSMPDEPRMSISKPWFSCTGWLVASFLRLPGSTDEVGTKAPVMSSPP
mmetsp:Transcript_39917/g.118369  ORF Transcript_39917/g.118369 Transcript_39917/m.118369 type:complete len:243 (+) Transcript_39917:272-1000(+)